MNILWLAPFPHPSEPTAHPVPWVGTLADLLKRQPGVRLTILNWSHRITTDVEEFDRDGLHFIYLKVPKVRLDILTLYQRRIAIVRQYLRRHAHRYDLLHLHGSELQLPAMTEGLGVPLLLSVQGIVSEYARVVPDRFSMLKLLWTMAGIYEKKYLPTVHHFSCRTAWDKYHTARLSPGCHIYHNWETIRPEFFAEADKPAPARPARPQALFVGGRQAIKGFKEMLLAFDLVRQQAPEIKLVIVGRLAPADVAAVAARYRLRHLGPEHVECRPFLAAAALARLCRESFCLLHPSYIDNSPNSVCEAQLMGLPVVASEVGGVGSLIQEGQTGLLTDLTPASVARQTLRLYHDPALWQRIAAQARAVALVRHNPDTIIAQTLAIYRHLLHTSPRPAPIPVPELISA